MPSKSTDSKTKNHEKAPVSAAFVKSMREEFGEDVKVVYLRENGLKIGKEPQ